MPKPSSRRSWQGAWLSKWQTLNMRLLCWRGRWLRFQVRKRRGEVEARLEEVNRECSSVKLQLRRLGVK